MNCDRVKSALSEFTDDTLDATTAWQIQTHLADCAACHSLNRELQVMRGLLQTLPTRQPSAQFESNLAQRLALTRRPKPRQTWRDRLLGSRRVVASARRPALAFGFALSAVAALIWLPQRLPEPLALPVSHSADRTFVADCVAQHRREAAAEPLADLAAQNLAGHLDNTAPVATDPAPTTFDAGLF